MKTSLGKSNTYDLTTMPMFDTYEQTYGRYMEIFHEIAVTPSDTQVTVQNPPISWIPLLYHLDCRLQGYQYYFKHDRLLPNFYRDLYNTGSNIDRTTLEVLCGFRPELVDALYKIDVEWDCQREKTMVLEEDFIVTTNGAFFRREVQEYLAKLALYKPTQRKVVLLPCSADKPYPSKLHRRVMEILPGDDWYIANITGTLGVVPHALWNEMPHYDAGIPNHWRVYTRVQQYFARCFHSRVVSYVDFYADVLDHALRSIGQGYKLSMIIGAHEANKQDYLPLHDDRYIRRLKEALHD
jgi:hypothetical protein